MLLAQSSQRQSECWHVAFSKIKVSNNCLFHGRKPNDHFLLRMCLSFYDKDIQGHSVHFGQWQLVEDIFTYYILWQLEKEHGRKWSAWTEPGKLTQSILCALKVELTARSAVNLVVFLRVNFNGLNWDIVPGSSDFSLSDNSSFCSATLYSSQSDLLFSWIFVIRIQRAFQI